MQPYRCLRMMPMRMCHCAHTVEASATLNPALHPRRKK
jgi:hypothetical protein